MNRRDMTDRTDPPVALGRIQRTARAIAAEWAVVEAARGVVAARRGRAAPDVALARLDTAVDALDQAEGVGPSTRS